MNNPQPVNTAIIGLVLILTIVYTAIYYKQQNNTEVNHTNIVDLTQDQESSTQGSALQPSNSIVKIQNNEADADYIDTAKQNIIDSLSTKESGTLSTQDTSDIYILPDTKIYMGNLSSLQNLGLDYQYILVDQKGIFYINLGQQQQDLASIARAHNGNIVEIISQRDLDQHQLFGDKIIFINIPEYQNNIILMIVSINGEKRLIQIDPKTYYLSKSYLKQRFIY